MKVKDSKYFVDINDHVSTCLTTRKDGKLSLVFNVMLCIFSHSLINSALAFQILAASLALTAL